MVLITGKEGYSLEFHRHRQLPDWLPYKPFLTKGAGGLPRSLMPKGVEHPDKLRAELGESDVRSLMPKGVEHPDQIEVGDQGGGIRSLMPKGVEHPVDIASWEIVQNCHDL